MYIQPNTTIKFLQNIPFDADYNDTVYFTPEDGVQGQYNYFNAKAKYTIQNNMYQRVNKNELKVSLPYTGITYESTAEKLYDCNYMMFQNTNFGNKWFYAFVKTVEWINNETAKITYEIDEMQTWMFDYDLEQCFVEREHSATDEIGDNLVPENLDLGYEMVEYKREQFHINTNTNGASVDEINKGWGIVVVYSKELDGDYALPEIKAPGILGSLGTYRFYMGSLNVQYESSFPHLGNEYGKGIVGFEQTLLDYTQRAANNLTPDEILLIYLCPMFINNNYSPENNVQNFSITRPNFLGTPTNAYTPNNKKLLCYPYTQLVLTNNMGATESFKYEYFQDSVPGRASFSIYGQSLYNPSLICVPNNYAPATTNISGSSVANKKGYDYGVVISDFPQMAWIGDTFKAWWAQNKSSFITSTALSIIGGLGETVIGGFVASTMPQLGAGMIAGGVTSIGKSVGGSLAKVNDLHNATPSVNGLSTASYLTSSMGYLGYDLISKSITAPQAKIIDDYFTMFGYACHEVKTPNRNVRPKWTYTQTVGCTIKARCPGDSQKKICQIYDKGIRFWNKNAEIGKYYNDNGTPINNSPVAG